MHEDADRLARLKAVFQLSDFQLAHLLGVDRAALRHWRKSGIPKPRRPDIAAMEALGERLAASLSRTIMHWPHPKLESKSPLLAVRTLGIVALCAQLAED